MSGERSGDRGGAGEPVVFDAPGCPGVYVPGVGILIDPCIAVAEYDRRVADLRRAILANAQVA